MTDLENLIDECGIDFSTEFVPWDGKGEPQLAWTFTLTLHGDPVRSGTFTAGVAHAPSYPAACSHGECRTGIDQKGRPIKPRPLELISCVVMDSRALDYPRFEDWAADFGFDPDSRKAEAIYRDCLQWGIALRAGLGSQKFDLLCEMCSEL